MLYIKEVVAREKTTLSTHHLKKHFLSKGGDIPMRKSLFSLISILMVAALLLAACTPAAEPVEEAPVVEEAAPEEEPAAVPQLTAVPVEAPAVEPTEEPAGPPDLTGETITLYHFGDLSGPLAAVTGPLIHGAEDAVAALNEAGGIYGATVEIKFSDTASSVDEAVAAYDRFTGEDDNALIMITYGSGEAEALAERFAEDQIVNITAGLSAKALYGPGSGYTFGLGPTFGQGGLSDESRAYLADNGIEIVSEDIYDVSPVADTTTGILNAQTAGANVIWNNTLAFGPAVLLNDLNALGVRDQFVVAADNWAMDLALYAFVADPAYGVGLISPFPYLWWTDADNRRRAQCRLPAACSWC
jgi:ABC-type branched-subunit amino acid transport system substrate-binding protein